MDKHLEAFYNRSLEGYPEHEHVRAFAVALQNAETKIKKLQADAKLGRMVRKMPKGHYIYNGVSGYRVVNLLSVPKDTEQERFPKCPTPEQALEAAGIKDD